MKNTLYLLLLLTYGVKAQSFAPQVGFDGSTAIHKDDTVFIDWANSVTITRGYQDIAHTENGVVGYGLSTDATNQANTNIVSLGDGGEAILMFNHAIRNGSSADFAVFENGFLEDVDSELAFLELAFVEVSTDGIDYVRFPAITEIASDIQINSFGFIDARYIDNFAGKYIQNHGTPFDLSDLTELIQGTTVDLNNINYIKIIDVTGTIDTSFASFDSEGNVVNDPYPTAFGSGGFDLNAIGIIHNSTTASQQDFTQSIVNMYPNPTENYVYLNTNATITKVHVFSLEGKLLYTTNNTFFSVEKLHNGLYIIQIVTDLGISYHELIKTENK